MAPVPQTWIDVATHMLAEKLAAWDVPKGEIVARFTLEVGVVTVPRRELEARAARGDLQAATALAIDRADSTAAA